MSRLSHFFASSWSEDLRHPTFWALYRTAHSGVRFPYRFWRLLKRK